MSSIDCLSAASFDAARGEQFRLPADETLKRKGREIPQTRCNTMLKLFRPESSVYIGQDIESWDRTWDEASIQEALRWATVSNMRPLFERYFPRRGKILEGGCGLGQFVIYFRSLGYDIEGVDFSPLAVSRLKAYDPALPVRIGDVANLSYPEGSIQCYFSGGVVEHFEDGPSVALTEARRVLTREGRLLITVPFINSLRQVQSFFGVSKHVWGSEPVILLARRQCAREEPPVEGYRFAEYLFGKNEFSRMLERCGFRVEEIRPCDLEWGELGQFLYRRFRRASHSQAAPGEGVGSPDSKTPDPLNLQTSTSENGNGNRLRAFWKEFFVSENPRQRWLRPLLRMLTEISGHMVLFVCRPIK